MNTSKYKVLLLFKPDPIFRITLKCGRTGGTLRYKDLQSSWAMDLRKFLELLTTLTFPGLHKIGLGEGVIQAAELTSSKPEIKHDKSTSFGALNLTE